MVYYFLIGQKYFNPAHHLKQVPTPDLIPQSWKTSSLTSKLCIWSKLTITTFPKRFHKAGLRHTNRTRVESTYRKCPRDSAKSSSPTNLLISTSNVDVYVLNSSHSAPLYPAAGMRLRTPQNSIISSQSGAELCGVDGSCSPNNILLFMSVCGDF